MLGLSLTGTPPAFAAADADFLYCVTDNGNSEILAGRTAADGDLKFGVSVWSHEGQNISVFGIAGKTGGGWRFTEDPTAATPAQRCRLDISRDPDGTAHVASAPDATCQSHGGVGASIGTLQFPRSAYAGPVTTELNDPEAFQKACVSKHR